MTHIMLATNLGSYNPGAVMPETKIKVLVCNAGSSSLKFSLFDAEDETLLANGSIDWLIKPARLAFRRANEPKISRFGGERRDVTREREHRLAHKTRATSFSQSKRAGNTQGVEAGETC